MTTPESPTSGCYQCGRELVGDSAWHFAPHTPENPREKQRLCTECEEGNKRAGLKARRGTRAA